MSNVILSAKRAEPALTFTAGIDIEFTVKATVRQLLHILAAAGWGYHHAGRICYVPMCSSDLDWEEAPASAWPDILVILETKQALKESASVVLYWDSTPYGCALHIFPNGDISLDCGTERVMLDGSDSFTDVSWYLARSVCPLQQAGLRVETVRFSEVQRPAPILAFEHPLSLRMTFGDEILSPTQPETGELAIR